MLVSKHTCVLTNNEIFVLFSSGGPGKVTHNSHVTQAEDSPPETKTVPKTSSSNCSR